MRLEKLYAPKLKLLKAESRPRKPPLGIFKWMPFCLQLSEEELLDDISVDAYLFLRLLYKAFYFFLLLSFAALPVLLPINYLDGNGLPGLSEWTIGNINTKTGGKTK